MIFRACAILPFVIFASTIDAQAEPSWQPSSFEGVYVQIIDNATNGCWTNIGEVRRYAEDQLALAGFDVVELPEFKEDIPHPVLRKNIAAYHLHVNASRKDNGLCIGYLNSFFQGAVAPGYNQKILIVGQIGGSYVWSVWSKTNLNHFMFDQVKDTIKLWVSSGVQPNDED